MNSIAKITIAAKGLWPFFLGLSLAWFLAGLWGSATHVSRDLINTISQATAADTSKLELISSRNILSLDNPAPQLPGVGPDPSGWKLLGIFSSTRPMVLLFIEGKSKTLKVGEQESGWTLETVQSNTAVFRSGALERTLTLFKDGVPATLPKSGSKNKVSLSKSEIAPVLADPGNLLQQALFKPAQEAGKTVGYRIDNIQENSILKKLGFQNGDILVRVNGDAIDGPAKMMQLYSGLQSAQAMNLDIKRGGDLMSLIVEMN